MKLKKSRNLSCNENIQDTKQHAADSATLTPASMSSTSTLSTISNHLNLNKNFTNTPNKRNQLRSLKPNQDDPKSRSNSPPRQSKIKAINSLTVKNSRNSRHNDDLENKPEHFNSTIRNNTKNSLNKSINSIQLVETSSQTLPRKRRHTLTNLNNQQIDGLNLKPLEISKMNKILRNKKNNMDRPAQFELSSLMFVENLDESSNNSTSSNKSSILTCSTVTESVSTTSTTSSTLYTLADNSKENEAGESKQLKQESKVLVPSWRITTSYKPFYRIEGIKENLTDETFLKRHQKYENEEIKIKRWDMRRQREEYERNKLLKGRQSISKVQPSMKLNESLAQTSHNKSAKRKRSDIDGDVVVCKQFDLANIDDIEYIEIVSEEDLKDVQNEVIEDEERQQEGNAPKEHDKKEKKSKKTKNKSINVNKTNSNNNKENNKTNNSTMLNGSNSNTSLSVYDDIDFDYQDESLANLTLNKTSSKLNLSKKTQKKRKTVSTNDSLSKANTSSNSVLQPPTKRKRLALN